MFNRVFWSVYLILIFASLSGVYSQYPSLVNDRNILKHQAEELVSLSDYIFGKDVRLVNGRIYSQPYTKARGHPFMKSPEWMTGSVFVNGKNFSGVKLNYDIYQDCLVYLNESPEGNNMALLLNKNQVRRFTVEEHSFITLNPSWKNSENQYFEILFEGKVSLFNKWTKTFESINSQEFPAGKFSDAKITRYLMKQNEFYKLSNRFDLFKLCADRKSEIKKYLRKHRISIRKGKDRQLAGLIEYYNSMIIE
jgi:hypothetical protein